MLQIVFIVKDLRNERFTYLVHKILDFHRVTYNWRKFGQIFLVYI